MLISAEHLSINFGSRQLLDDVDFYLNEGDKTGVIGINGTGKSTFLKVLAGKLQPDGGTIARKPNLQVSVLAQNPDMRDELTVLEQVFASMPPEFRQLNEYEAKRMLTQLGLVDTDRRIGTLSGGERQRVAVGRALLCRPRLLLMDEPLAALDMTLKRDLLAYLARIPEHWDLPVLYVTHAPGEALALGSAMLLLQAGRLAAQGPVAPTLAEARRLGLLPMDTFYPTGEIFHETSHVA